MGQYNNIKIGNKSSESEEQFSFCGTTLKIKTFIHKEIKNKLNSGECILSFSAASFVFQVAIKSIKIKMYRIIILPVVLHGCETWSPTLRVGHRLRVFKIVC